MLNPVVNSGVLIFHYSLLLKYFFKTLLGGHPFVIADFNVQEKHFHVIVGISHTLPNGEHLVYKILHITSSREIGVRYFPFNRPLALLFLISFPVLPVRYKVG